MVSVFVYIGSHYLMPNVWYAKCHEKAIVYLRFSPYLCSVTSFI